MEPDSSVDVVIVGGSTAGLSAALTLGRALRRVLVLDAGRPCNRQTPHSHNFFTRDGETPAQLLALGRAQLQAYPTVAIHSASVVEARKVEAGFELTTDDGRIFRSKRVLLATGLQDHLPSLPGFAESWGVSVLHCPYCHGYEVHDRPLGVLGNGDGGFELARLIRHWTPDLRLFTDGPSTLSAEQTRQLVAHNIRLIETPLAEIEHEACQLHHLRLTDGTREPLTALYARVPFTLPGTLHQQLGCALTEQGLLKVDEVGRTSVEGVSAAGDNSSPMRQLAMAAANGSKAAAFLNNNLIETAF
ncbi:NAD(P)/FAD-dependent oxidoreductase [Microvirga sp. STR05]|uniref:NAD(P)/FAD-dependent oxidoreductase n=1 Tax=Hymenobacter duratus TaxID=2771356 RepID=A0ABR8JJA2_9BACT|nr:NAD(P)/FAD-dependent oxidoreductase [Hymenobacter duratus]MBD2714884.1 NAD(P)/FAD-dependent oxidoreductase [Hymenobacter duratus]MBR7949790.1 NAD(P)/FAD-dependent oxidoreductase [Microvirga sp. STR05]